MPALASANRVQLAYIPEVTFGVTPATAPFNLRMTGESLAFDLTKESDKEINATGELTSSTTVGAQASGDIKMHMQYAEYDRFFAAVMRSAWAVHGTNGVGTAFSGTFAATTITAGAAPVGANAFTTLQKGQWFKVFAPGDANNGKLLRVSTVTAPTATVITLDANTPATVAAAIAGCTISTSRIQNALALQSFTIERQVAEVGRYFAYRGMHVSKFSTEFASSAMTEGTFNFLGKDLVPGAATTLTGVPTDSKTYDIQNGVKGVGKLWENGAPVSGKIKKMSIDIDSGLRAQDALGELGLAGVGIGTFTVKGSLEVYFSDGALFDKFLNDVYTSVILSTYDTAGNGYVITLPKIQLTKATVMAGSRDSDLMASFEYTAYKDVDNVVPALRSTMFLDRFGAAVV
jgi:hypothetical protein